MAESALNRILIDILRPFDPVRVENAVGPGTPDINFALGWIESKFLPRWPTRVDTVKCVHYTVQQRAWHRRRIFAGGKVWVVIQIEQDYLLFRGDVAAAVLGNTNETGLKMAAIGYWHKSIDRVEFLTLLRTSFQ